MSRKDDTGKMEEQPTPTIEKWELYDIEFDLAELEPADWDAMAARIRWHLSTPYAVALKSIFGEALVSGLGLGIAHEGSGWLGDVLMHPRFRSDELLTHLVRAVMDALRAKGCSTISALVTPEQEAAFTALGFASAGRYVRYAGGKTEVPTLDEVELCEPHHSMGILRLDKLASGEDRRTLISEHFYASRIFVNKGRVQGNYIVLLGEGHVIAENDFAGLELLRWHLPHTDHVWLPEANTAAIEFLEQRKYAPTGTVTRMYHGPALNWRPEMHYARIGNNLG